MECGWTLGDMDIGWDSPSEQAQERKFSLNELNELTLG